MSDANVPLPREPDASETRGGDSSEWEVPSPYVSKSKPESKPEPTPNYQDWQTVNFPNTIDVDSIPPDAASDQNRAAALTVTTNSSAREAELMKLVSDLNQCNDNLLRRITQLEETLERSQAALQAEIERSQEASARAEQTPPSPSNPNAQIAQLVSELDSTQQALQRQKILTETLQAQLETSQQRGAQLERECALIQQRYTKQSQAVMEAEATCRDLRSRLQRQQHYTLQFKAALEKSLDMSSHSGQAPLPLSSDYHSKIQSANKRVSPQPITMPKAQRIQPWTSDATLPRQSPNLEVLIRGLTPSSAISSSNPTQTNPASSQSISISHQPSSASVQPAGQSDLEAEALLWRDMERVIDGSRKLSDQVGPPRKTAASSDQSALPPAPDNQSKLPAVRPESPFGSDPTSAAGTQTEGLTFTEPSPWGVPLKSSQQPAEPPPANPSNLLTTNQSADAFTSLPPNPANLSGPIPTVSNQPTLDSPPALNPQSVANSPSPIVYPLRPQKKIKSLAAVELPNFPRKQSPKS